MGLDELAAACETWRRGCGAGAITGADPALLVELECRGFSPADQVKLMEDGLCNVEDLAMLCPGDFYNLGIDTFAAAKRAEARVGITVEETAALHQFLDEHGQQLSHSAKLTIMDFVRTMARLVV